MRALITMRELKNKQIKAILALFTRDELRKLARVCDIPTGRLKSDTIHNLMVMKDQGKLKDLLLRIQIL